jgi:hypothetical protein
MVFALYPRDMRVLLYQGKDDRIPRPASSVYSSPERLWQTNEVLLPAKLGCQSVLWRCVFFVSLRSPCRHSFYPLLVHNAFHSVLHNGCRMELGTQFTSTCRAGCSIHFHNHCSSKIVKSQCLARCHATEGLFS